MKPDHILTSHAIINSKWIKDLSVRHQPIKLLIKNLSGKLSDFAFSNILSDISSQARETKEKNKQRGLHQTKMFLYSKGNH